MVGGFLRVLRLLPPLKLVTIIIAEILLKVALNTTNKFKSKYIIPAITSMTTRQFDKAELYFTLTHPLLVVYVDIYITVQMIYDLCVMPLRRSFHTLDVHSKKYSRE
jgi:hypothetical protein